MSFLFRKSFDPQTFEKELSNLSQKISKNQRSLVSYRYQQTKIRNFLIFYGSLSYLIHIFYILIIKNKLDFKAISWIEIITILGFPLIVFLLNKLLQILYTIKINRTESYIELLRNQHISKIDELKEKTKFSSTQALLNRFNSEGEDLNAVIDEELLQKQQKLDEINLSLKSNSKTFQAYPKTSWLDSIVDSVVGSNELNPANRYALICPNCSVHNGLAPPNTLPENVRYICPHCGFINGIAQKPVEVISAEEKKTTEQEEEKTTEEVKDRNE